MFAEHEGNTVTIDCNIYTTLSTLPIFAFAVQSFNPKQLFESNNKTVQMGVDDIESHNLHLVYSLSAGI